MKEGEPTTGGVMKSTGFSVAILLVCSLSVGCEADRGGGSDATRVWVFMADADTYLDQGMVDSALAAFGLALEEDATLTGAHVGMGHIYRERGYFDLAGRAYERAVVTDPNSFDAHYYLGLTRQFLGRVQEAIGAYLRALAIDPDSHAANRDLAAAYLQVGQTALALTYARRATQIVPENQPAWCNLAATYSLLGQYEQAVDAYRQAAELGDLVDPVMIGLADAHLRLGNYQRAVNVLETLLRRSASTIAQGQLGYALFRLRRFEQALASYRQAVELAPQDTAALNGVGTCLMTLYIQGPRDTSAQRDEAVEAWRRSLRLRRHQPHIIDLLSRYGRL